jgi:hypothetical protein
VVGHDETDGVEIRARIDRDGTHGQIMTIDVLVDGDPERWIVMSMLMKHILSELDDNG